MVFEMPNSLVQSEENRLCISGSLIETTTRTNVNDTPHLSRCNSLLKDPPITNTDLLKVRDASGTTTFCEANKIFNLSLIFK